ncbi:MAG: ATP phosphoribosyltransferase regulatory subunit, partial [Bacillota bacterium]|nr:ATP phosphoribosyltransferase regulatory subunit [Bacillota bacterium]
APSLLDYLDTASQQHFAGLCSLLDKAQIAYQINPRLVRGLDYYDLSVFEWVTDQLGAQGTVCAGGRYNGLIAQFNAGKAIPAMGFAIGVERLMALLENNQQLPSLNVPSAYFITVGDNASQQGLLIAEQLRSQLPKLHVVTHCGGGSFKNQFKHADKSGATWALILGDDELAKNTISIKYLREDRQQETLSLAELIVRLKN